MAEVAPTLTPKTLHLDLGGQDRPLLYVKEDAPVDLYGKSIKTVPLQHGVVQNNPDIHEVRLMRMNPQRKVWEQYPIDPNGSADIQEADMDKFAIRLTDKHHRTIVVPFKDHFTLTPPTPEPAPQNASAPPPSTESDAFSQLQERAMGEKHRVITVTGEKGLRDRRAIDLAETRMEKETMGGIKTWWKRFMREYFTERYRQFYTKALDAAATPFAKASIEKAEEIATGKYGALSGLQKFGERIKNAFGIETNVQKWAIEELQNKQHDALKPILEQEQAAFAREQDAFGRRFELEFDKQADELVRAGIVRAGMGEKVIDADQGMKTRIKEVIKTYCTNGDKTLADQQLTNEVNTIFTQLRNDHPDLFKDADRMSSSITAVAKEMRQQLEITTSHEQGLSALDRELEAMQVRLGLGTMGESTQLAKTDTMKALDWVDRHGLTAFFGNEYVAGTAVSAALSLWVLPRAVASRTARLAGGIAGGGALTGLLSGLREYKSRKEEFLRVASQWETGTHAGPDQKRRAWYEAYNLHLRSVNDLVHGMHAVDQGGIYEADGKLKQVLTKDQIQTSLANLADAKARQNVGSREKNRYGLIEIGAVGQQETNRTFLNKTTSTVERDLTTYLSAHSTQQDVQEILSGKTAQDFINLLTDTQTKVIAEGFDLAATTDHTVQLALSRLGSYNPEIKFARERLHVFGLKLFSRDVEAKGLDNILKEFRTQARWEAVQRGISSGTIGAGAGLVANELAMDVGGYVTRNLEVLQGDFSHLTDIRAEGAISQMLHEGNLLPSWLEHAVGAGGFHPQTLPDGSPMRLTNNTWVDHTDNLNVTGTVNPSHTAVIQDFSHHVIHNADGTYALDDTAKNALQSEGFTGNFHMEHIPVTHPSGEMTSELFGGRYVTLPTEVKFIANPSDHTENVFYVLKDQNGHDVQQLIASHVPVTAPGNHDPSILEALQKHRGWFRLGLTDTPVAVPSETVPVPGHEFTMQIPHGMKLLANGDHYDLANTDGTTVVSDIHIGTDGKIDINELSQRLPKNLSIHESVTEWSTTKEVGGTTDLRDVHFLPASMQQTMPADPTYNPDGVGPGGFTSWIQDRLHESDLKFEHQNAVISGLKHAMRGYYHSIDPNAQSVQFDPIKGAPGIVRSLAFHETVNGNELNFNALPNNTVLRLPNGIFGDEQMGKLGHLMDNAIDKYEPLIKAGTPRVELDKLLSSSNPQERLDGILLKMGYFSQEKDIPTKEELEFLMQQLGGKGTETGLRYGYEIVETTTQPSATITALPLDTMVTPVLDVREYEFVPKDSFVPILGKPREGLEAPLESVLVTPYFEEFSSQDYYGIKKSNQESWKKVRSPRLLQNEKTHLNQQEELSWYFDQQKRAYMIEVDGLNNQINRPMNPNVKAVICMPVAAHAESENIYNTLMLYAKQEDIDWTQVEINLFVNWPHDADQTKIQKTLEQIHKFQNENPDKPVNVFTREFQRSEVKYGKIVKYLNDVVLRRIQQAQIPHDVMLLTNDADCIGMSKHYLQQAVSLADSSRDGALGKIDWGTSFYPDFPGFHVSTRFFQMCELLSQKQHVSHRRVGSSGANFAVKASMFAAIGGYNDELGAGADTEIGRKIIAARLGNKKHFTSESDYPLVYRSNLWLETNPRRAYEYYKQGKSIINMWEDFDEGGYKVSQLKPGNKESLQTDWNEILERISYQINTTVEHWLGYDNKSLYVPALNWLFGTHGWTLDDDVIQLTERGGIKLKTDLLEYQQKNRQNIKYSGSNPSGIKGNASFTP